MNSINSTAKLNQNLINNSINSKTKSKTNGIQIRKAKVLSVESDYSYATVKLFGDSGQTLRLINKTGEKLHTGDGVRIEFSTDITCGWIAVRNGKVDPLSVIECASVVPQKFDNVYQKIQNTFDVDVNNFTKTGYGNNNNRYIVGGYVMPLWTVALQLLELQASAVEFQLRVNNVEPSYSGSGSTLYDQTQTVQESYSNWFDKNADCAYSSIFNNSISVASIKCTSGWFIDGKEYNNAYYIINSGDCGQLFVNNLQDIIGIIPTVISADFETKVTEIALIAVAKVNGYYTCSITSDYQTMSMSDVEAQYNKAITYEGEIQPSNLGDLL